MMGIDTYMVISIKNVFISPPLKCDTCAYDIFVFLYGNRYYSLVQVLKIDLGGLYILDPQRII